MISAVVTVLVFSLAAVSLFYSRISYERTPSASKKHLSFVLVLSAAFTVRLFAAFFYSGHPTDMSCFDSWSDMIFAEGFGSFYTSDAFTDYPPGYMYVLYFIGFVKDTLSLNKAISYILLKLPAIVCDLLCGAVIYKLSKKNSNSYYSSIFSVLFLFNPAVIFNSAIWGQVDSVFTLFVLIMLYFLTERKTAVSYFAFAIAVFIKPQALFYTPVLIYAIIENVFLNGFSKKKFIINLLSGLCAIALMFALAYPFGIGNVIEQYKATIGSYSYASVNAYNIWTALGLNWAELNPLISAVGYLAIVVIVAFSAVIFFSKKSENKYFYTAAFICFSTFMLSAKMHERYAFPALPLMLCACCMSLKKREFGLYIGISAVQLLNMVHVLFYYSPETFYNSGFVPISLVISWLSVILLLLFWIYSKKEYCTKVSKTPIPPERSEALPSVTKRDMAAAVIITLIYSAVALYNLGDTSAPQTYETLEADTPITVNLGENTEISEIKIYLGALELSANRRLDLSLIDENGSVTYSQKLENGNVFFWTTLQDISASAQYLTISASDTVYILEMGIYDDEKRLITPDTASKLFDEQSCVPAFESFRNSTYFDEIYHARTAYEFLHKMPVYEWTHPPLGKIFISQGIRSFGMTPFGWRIVGTLFGILMIPTIYIFSKKMFGMTWLSACTSLLFAFDFMHFAQTRIATIDVYVTFFIMLMYLFMYKYYCISFNDTSLKKTFIPLGLCGAAMGFGIACKWTGIYAGAGLAVIFFICLYKRYREGNTEFRIKAFKTIMFCLLAFIAVPIGIYLLSYIPFVRCSKSGIDSIIQNQIDMFTYHGKTVVSAEHAFSSLWYMWPINFRPIWYYSGTNGDLTENISSFGNPLIWWSGIAAFFYCLYDAIRNKNKNALFLVIAYLAQLAPWIPVTRTTFIYHYFPCVPFVVLMLAHTACRLYEKKRSYKIYFAAYTLLAIMLFILFYPVISGYPINGDFVRDFLRWLPSWQLIG
ncbi:MAG: glycosyltransferase family 39 protein [Clostridia bacterium]|nr:glycosyltransferase family 39 protein [Clostridia bacterium]